MANKVAITGATGFLGRQVAMDYLDRGYEVRCLVRKPDSAGSILGNDVEIVQYSLDDAGSLRRATRGCGLIVHTAAIHSRKLVNGMEIYRVNVEGTRNLIEALDSVDAFVMVSSIRSMMTTRSSDVDEETQYDFAAYDTPYGATKYQSEQLCLDYYNSQGLPLYIVNPAVIIGPEDRRPSLNGKMISDHLEKKISFVTEATWNIVDVRDASAAIEFVLKNGKKAERHIVCSATMSLKDFFRSIDKISGRKKLYVSVPYLPLEIAGRVFELVEKVFPRFCPPVVGSGATIAKLRTRYSGEKLRKMGFVFRSAEDTIKDTVRWFLKNKIHTESSRKR